MKIIKKSLLVGAISTALAGCGDESFKPEAKGANFAPESPGNIEVTVNEKDDIFFTFLLGTTNGFNSYSEDGVEWPKVTDGDGDLLYIENVMATAVDLDGFEADDLTGFEIQGNTVLIRPSALVDDLDTGETRTVEFTYDISDGSSSISRKATLNVVGEDFMPVAEDGFVRNYTKNSDATIDLLSRVTDADGEPLTTSNFVPDAANPLDIEYTFSNNQLVLDIDSVADDINDGELVTFNFTYEISDHRFTIERDLEVNILGVLDVAGAPSTQIYFLEESINETNAADAEAVHVYDLLQDVIDREGDDMEVNTFQVNGVDGLMPGLTLVDNNLYVYPNAFIDEVDAGESKDYAITYKMQDINGFVADGVRTLTLTVNGIENNLLSVNGFTNPGFEDETLVGTDNVNDGGWQPEFFNWGCGVKEIRSSSARTGSYGFRMEGDFCDYSISSAQFIPLLGAGEKYVYSYWIRSETGGANDNPYLVFLDGSLGFFNGFSSRLSDADIGVWKEDARIIDSTEFGFFNGSVGKGITHRFSVYAAAGGSGRDLDDFSLIRFSDYDESERNLLSEDGMFENNETIVSSAGIAEIRNDGGDNKLFVDTTGTTGVTVSLPLMTGSILPGGRYMASFDIQYINHTLGDSLVYGGLSNGSESINNSANLSAASADSEQRVDVLLTEEYNRTADVEWNEETMTFDISFFQTDAQFYINNVRVYAIP